MELSAILTTEELSALCTKLRITKRVYEETRYIGKEGFFQELYKLGALTPYFRALIEQKCSLSKIPNRPIDCAFKWCITEEGTDYWRTIKERLSSFYFNRTSDGYLAEEDRIEKTDKEEPLTFSELNDEQKLAIVEELERLTGAPKIDSVTVVEGE